MILTQILKPKCIKIPLDSKDKASAIRELIDLLGSNGVLADKEAALASVLQREQTRSTGIGSGIAIPHGKCEAVKDFVMAIGLAGEPIDFSSVDGQAVKIIFLLVSPLDQTGPHIQALAKISRLMLDDEFKSKLEGAQSAEEVYELLSSRSSG